MAIATGFRNALGVTTVPGNVTNEALIWLGRIGNAAGGTTARIEGACARTPGSSPGIPSAESGADLTVQISAIALLAGFLNPVSTYWRRRSQPPSRNTAGRNGTGGETDAAASGPIGSEGNQHVVIDPR